MKPVLVVLSLLLSVSIAAFAGTRTYRPRPAVTVDHDDANIPEPRARDTTIYYEFIDKTMFGELRKVLDVPRTVKRWSGHDRAVNVNSMDEVPDSSWFTNRVAARNITAEELQRGPNTHPGPAFDGPITVVDGKEHGFTPGLVLKDKNGVTWYVKFDAPENPEMASAAEVISTKLLWGIGYNVPENWIAHFRRDQLRIEAGARVIDERGVIVPMTSAQLERVLSMAAVSPGGSYRCMASRKVPGRLKGGWGYIGTREDDPNDLIPHQQRRDVRALRIFCAWLAHEDIKSGNTLSAYIDEHDRHYLRHYLWDFGSTLGSAGWRVKGVQEGHANLFDWRLTGEEVPALGLWYPHWRTHPAAVTYPSVGRFTAVDFDPERWKPTFPNRAFDDMTDADAYWAAKIVGAFSDDLIRAAVQTGELSDPRAADYIVRTLIQRRDIIVRRWYKRVTALQNVTARAVENGHQDITFTDLAVQKRAVPGGRSYTYQVFLTNAAGGPAALSPALDTEGRSAIRITNEVFDKVGQALSRGEAREEQRVVHVEIRASNAAPVRVYFVYDGPDKGLRLVGIEHAG